MAIMRLETPMEWGWDTATGQLVVRMYERPPSDEEGAYPDGDEATWVPTRRAEVRFTPDSVDVEDLTP